MIKKRPIPKNDAAHKVSDEKTRVRPDQRFAKGKVVDKGRPILHRQGKGKH